MFFNNISNDPLFIALSDIVNNGKVVDRKIESFGISEIKFVKNENCLELTWYSGCFPSLRTIKINNEDYMQDTKIARKIFGIAIDRVKNLIEENKIELLKKLS